MSSSGDTLVPCCLSSASASSLPRVARRLCPGLSTASVTLSVAFSKSNPCKDFKESLASDVKYGFNTVSKYSSCRDTSRLIKQSKLKIKFVVIMSCLNLYCAGKEHEAYCVLSYYIKLKDND